MIGIDVSKASLAITCLHPVSQRLCWEMTVPNSPAGIGRILKRTPQATPWVVEPTGRYSLTVVKEAAKHQQVVLMAQPKRAKAFLNALSPRAKTDRLDSYGLARYGLAVPLDPYPVKPEVVDRVDQLLTARKGLSRALMSLRQQQAELPAAAAYLSEAIAGLKAQLDAIDAGLAETTKALPDVERLDAVPGIGPVIATSVAACLVAKAFPTPAAFVAYIGLDTKVNESGTHRGQRRLTKQGAAELRRLLYLAAQANLRVKASPFRLQYERERAKGLSSTAALNAVARKLARLCWSLVRHQTRYEAALVYTQRELPALHEATL